MRPDGLPPLELLAACVLALIASLAASVASPLVGALAGFGAIAAILGAGWHSFNAYGVLIDPLFPSATIVVSYLAGVVELFRHERSQKAQVKNAFGRFVSPAVVERLAASPDRLTLGGEGRVITLMFCDLRDFTHISEGFDASEIIAFMNDYLTPMSDLVLASGGTIDKYIGDAIMAFWNAPLDDPDHARNACRTALAMRAALVAFNATRATADAAHGRAQRVVRFGLGLNTGFCSVGNIGSIRRFDYSAIGDPVNVASRIESLTKFYAIDLMASEETQKAAPDFAWLEIDSVRVKGRETLDAAVRPGRATPRWRRRRSFESSRSCTRRWSPNTTSAPSPPRRPPRSILRRWTQAMPPSTGDMRRSAPKPPRFRRASGARSGRCWRSDAAP